jgi:hypothetical protein
MIRPIERPPIAYSIIFVVYMRLSCVKFRYRWAKNRLLESGRVRLTSRDVHRRLQISTAHKHTHPVSTAAMRVASRTCVLLSPPPSSSTITILTTTITTITSSPPPVLLLLLLRLHLQLCHFLLLLLLGHTTTSLFPFFSSFILHQPSPSIMSWGGGGRERGGSHSNHNEQCHNYRWVRCMAIDFAYLQELQTMHPM